MQRPDFNDFFQEYAALYNRALSDQPDYQSIANLFADCYIAASPSGVHCGQPNSAMLLQLEQGFDFYKDLGAKRMDVTRTLETQIDDLHDLVRVFYRADYEKDGAPISIDFDVTYVLQTRDATKIFAFIAGDEMEAYRRAGLID